MTNEQLYLAIGVPMLFNAVLVGILIAFMNARFDSMRDLWPSELHRVEKVLDARLKHIEKSR